MHAHVISVSFLCVDLSCLGSPEPQKIKLKRTKVHAFCIYITLATPMGLKNNKITKQTTMFNQLKTTKQ